MEKDILLLSYLFKTLYDQTWLITQDISEEEKIELDNTRRRKIIHLLANKMSAELVSEVEKSNLFWIVPINIVKDAFAMGETFNKYVELFTRLDKEFKQDIHSYKECMKEGRKLITEFKATPLTVMMLHLLPEMVENGLRRELGYLF